MLNRYKYSLIQYHDMFTKEIINLGVILINGKDISYHIPKDYKKINRYIKTDIERIAFTINILVDRIESYNTMSYGEISDSIVVTQPKTYKSKSDAHNAFSELSKKYLSMISQIISQG